MVAGDNKTYVPNRNYSITYNLNGGSVATANPTTYSTKDAVTLRNPTKNTYDFAGWEGTGLSSKQKSVTIPQGSYGNRSYTACWEEGAIWSNTRVPVRISNIAYLQKIRTYQPDGQYTDYQYTDSSTVTISAYEGRKVVLYSKSPRSWTIANDVWGGNQSLIGNGIAIHFSVPTRANLEGTTAGVTNYTFSIRSSGNGPVVISYSYYVGGGTTGGTLDDYQVEIGE